MSNINDNNLEVIRVVHNEGEEHPWELKFDDVSVLKRARAILNYPKHTFDTEEKAVEVAQMLRDIIKADAVTVEGEDKVLDDVQPAEFFQSLPSDEDSKAQSSASYAAPTQRTPVAGDAFATSQTTNVNAAVAGNDNSTPEFIAPQDLEDRNFSEPFDESGKQHVTTREEITPPPVLRS